jgi:predicted AAA+ superfamily ATPase
LLEQAYVIYRLRGFSRNLSKEISKQDKIYFYDIGVRNAILNNFSDPHLRIDKGAIWENFLLSERIKRNEYQSFRPNLYFWRTYTGAEIDFIEEKDGVLNAFEFKFNQKNAKVPATWHREYPNSTFNCINLDNFQSFVG